MDRAEHELEQDRHRLIGALFEPGGALGEVLTDSLEQLRVVVPQRQQAMTRAQHMDLDQLFWTVGKPSHDAESLPCQHHAPGLPEARQPREVGVIDADTAQHLKAGLIQMSDEIEPEDLPRREQPG
jgi:hypothetical protein